MLANEVKAATMRALRCKSVFVEGIVQPALRELTEPLDAVVNGVTLRLPPGCVIGLTGGGSGGPVGSLMCDLDFVALDGRTYRATKGMQLQIPAG